ncbi:hypothetical protein HNE05_03555 [Aquipseudomonas campi]|uniref:Uncharacterized protein n=1 Tax=Aquipseudomonas campi TaxID=2731681 RepID=A0A6M8F5G6_9GAMM|nr:DUF6713 family protein [Pseudomonas campi]QKE62471.1 hypothetical protein HNE05_03555 [Pseudomonas campi]
MERSFFLTMCLLILHQIDAAFWREWEMFYLPGGVQGYLLFNSLIIPVVLLGYKHVIQSSSKAIIFATVCATLGVLTFLIHSGFALAGLEQFHLPLSRAIIALCLLSSLWQFIEVRKFYLRHAVA